MVAPSHLKSLQALELAARLGSLKAAADALSITPAAVGQRVKALEDYLGMDLLVRGRSGLKPTPQLEAALPHLTGAFRELESASHALDLQRTHEIHVAAPSDFTELWLMPRLDAFRAAHPNIRFSINGEGDAPLRLGAVDCEVSFGPTRKGGTIDALFGDFVLPITSPENARRIARVPDRGQLEGFPLLHLDFYRDDPSAPDWAAWIKKNRMRRTAPDRGIRFRRITLALEAVHADAGLTICGLALIQPLLRDGTIVLPFPLKTGAHTTHRYSARFREDAAKRPQVRRFREWLLSEAKTTRAYVDALPG